MIFANVTDLITISTAQLSSELGLRIRTTQRLIHNFLEATGTKWNPGQDRRGYELTREQYDLLREAKALSVQLRMPFETLLRLRTSSSSHGAALMTFLDPQRTNTDPAAPAPPTPDLMAEVAATRAEVQDLRGQMTQMLALIQALSLPRPTPVPAPAPAPVPQAWATSAGRTPTEQPVPMPALAPASWGARPTPQPALANLPQATPAVARPAAYPVSAPPPEGIRPAPTRRPVGDEES